MRPSEGTPLSQYTPGNAGLILPAKPELAACSISPSISAEGDLREIGLASMDMVSLMLAVEAEFGLTISDADMTIENFRTIAAIDTLVASLQAQK